MDFIQVIIWYLIHYYSNLIFEKFLEIMLNIAKFDKQKTMVFCGAKEGLTIMRYLLEKVNPIYTNI